MLDKRERKWPINWIEEARRRELHMQRAENAKRAKWGYCCSDKTARNDEQLFVV